MLVAVYNKFNQTVEDWLHGVYSSDTDQFTVALTASANPPLPTDSVLSDLTEVSYANLSSRNLTTANSSQVGGVFNQLFNDLVLTASGGPSSTFRYVVIYNNTPTSPADPLLSWYDYGSNLTLGDGETLAIDFTTSTFSVQ